jgi:hypothetical protein
MEMGLANKKYQKKMGKTEERMVRTQEAEGKKR